jgi:TfoX/Sxy family transcriptional regulator of competence genes
MDCSSSPEECFALLVGALLEHPGVTSPMDGSKKGFGADGLKVYDKIFAMLVRGRLVVKLSTLRVDELVASGEGERFDPRHDGRLMKKWVMLHATSSERWLHLAKEALEFVRNSSSA